MKIYLETDEYYTDLKQLKKLKLVRKSYLFKYNVNFPLQMCSKVLIVIGMHARSTEIYKNVYRI
jgi:hypothetical protein